MIEKGHFIYGNRRYKYRVVTEIYLSNKLVRHFPQYTGLGELWIGGNQYEDGRWPFYFNFSEEEMIKVWTLLNLDS